MNCSDAAHLTSKLISDTSSLGVALTLQRNEGAEQAFAQLRGALRRRNCCVDPISNLAGKLEVIVANRSSSLHGLLNLFTNWTLVDPLVRGAGWRVLADAPLPAKTTTARADLGRAALGLVARLAGRATTAFGTVAGWALSPLSTNRASGTPTPGRTSHPSGTGTVSPGATTAIRCSAVAGRAVGSPSRPTPTGRSSTTRAARTTATGRTTATRGVRTTPTGRTAATRAVRTTPTGAAGATATCGPSRGPAPTGAGGSGTTAALASGVTALSWHRTEAKARQRETAETARVPHRGSRTQMPLAPW